MRHDRDGAAEGGLLIYVRDGICISRIRNLETPLDAIIWVLIQGNGQSSDLTVFTKDVFDISFVNGPGLTSTFPIISVK
jgi:hypothetical protein